MTLSPPECLVVGILFWVPGLVVMTASYAWFGGATSAVFWAGMGIGFVGVWYVLQSLTREWVYTDEDLEPEH